MSLPPPGEPGPDRTPPGEPGPDRTPPGEPGPDRHTTILELESPAGGLKRLVGRRGAGRLVVNPAYVTIEQPSHLRAPLELAPGGIAVAAIDPGPARAEGAVGRFAILHRLSPTSIIPRQEGIDGWLWTSTGGSAYTLLAEEDVAPNLALVFLKPLEADVVSEVFDPVFLEDLAKRSPMGSPTVFGVLLRVARPHDAETTFKRLGLTRPLTDREVPPTQRRHLPTDKPANPELRVAVEDPRARTSMPPPGVG